MVAGEASGDALGARLAEALQRRRPGLKLSGVGGPAMRSAGVDTWFDVSDLEVVGIIEVAARLPSLRRVRARVLREAERGRFAAAVLVDYPGFNLCLARGLRARGIKVAQFVAPQIWAWGRWRARWMARSIDRLLVILPFEVEFFRSLGIDAAFVGNPLIDSLKAGPPEAARQRLGLAREAGGPVVAVLPGSREGEVARLLPPMLEAVRILRGFQPGARFLSPVAETLPWEEIAARLAEAGVQPVRGSADALQASDAAMVASGTAVLEAALLGTPAVLVYRFHPLTYPLVRWMSDLPRESYYLGLVNIVAGEGLFPELVQDQLTPGNLALEVRRLLEDEKRRAYVKRRLEDVRRSLGEKGCFDRAAEAVLDLVRP